MSDLGFHMFFKVADIAVIEIAKTIEICTHFL